MNPRYEEKMKNKSFLPFRMGHMTDEMVDRAQKELGETEEIRRTAILQLREMIQNEPKLFCRTDDEFLLQYLRARKFNLKKSFALVQTYYQVKKSHGDLFDECDLPALKKAVKSGAVSFLPYRDADGCPVLLIRMEKWNPEESSVQSIISALTMGISFCADDPATQVCGVRVLFDTKGTTLKHVTHTPPRYINLIAKALRNCFPLRFKGIHMYNQSSIFQHLWSIFSFFLSDKIRNRVYLHGDNQKQLHKVIPKEILPSEYGGDYTSFDEDNWYAKEAERFYDTYVDLHRYGYRT